MPTSNFYFTAATAVCEVIDSKRSLDAALTRARNQLEPARAARLAELCYGACRYYHYYDGMLAQLIDKPIKSRDRIVHFLLINACHQLDNMRAPDYAVVDGSVDAVKGGRFAWADKLINAVLRGFVARRDSLRAHLPTHAQLAFPKWLHEKVNEAWPAQCAQICDASNQKPPLTLRVNRRKISRDDYLRKLDEHGMRAQPTEHGAFGVTLQSPTPVERIFGFADGLASVQDESAQLVGVDCAPRKGERVLDACAAPGGKTGLLLEAEPEIALVALDSAARNDAVRENLARLTLRAEVIDGDLTRRQTWWDGRAFDCVLLDAPCTGSGVIRRHPDIKHRRASSDVDQFAAQQCAMLTDAWAMLRKSGVLLYVTCSILPDENDAVIETFIDAHRNATPQPLTVPGIATRFGKQRLPGVHPGDGFYYCKLQNDSAH